MTMTSCFQLSVLGQVSRRMCLARKSYLYLHVPSADLCVLYFPYECGRALCPWPCVCWFMCPVGLPAFM